MFRKIKCSLVKPSKLGAERARNELRFLYLGKEVLIRRQIEHWEVMVSVIVEGVTLVSGMTVTEDVTEGWIDIEDKLVDMKSVEHNAKRSLFLNLFEQS